MGETTVPREGVIRSSSLLALALSILILAGCGGKSSLSERTSSVRAPAPSVTRGRGVPASAVAVIEGWADALRGGHLQRAAAYWARPSVMVNGLSASGRLALIRIRSTRDALAADESLPCGATLRSTGLRGRYVRARFVLGARAGVSPSNGCSGVADVDFLIGKGHIERWLRAPTGSGGAAGAPGATSA